VFSHPELDFPYFAEVTPYVEEGLLIPFYIGGEAVGTIWVISHDESHRFDAEDLRVMTNLGSFAAAAYQTWLSLETQAKANEELRQSALTLQRFASIVQSSDDAIVSRTSMASLLVGTVVLSAFLGIGPTKRSASRSRC
jgi:transcriptional regulator with GAF, ATPase, and Fis domain